MLFQACAEGKYQPGRTYHKQRAERVYANALGCIERGLTALVEVRLEGKKMTVVRVLAAEERCAAWTGVLVRYDGAQLWYRNGQLHREGDLPAFVWANGYQKRLRNGQLHREEGPAGVYSNGDQVRPK